MRMSDQSKQQVVQEFFSKRSHSPRKRQNWILLFYQSGRSSKHIEYTLRNLSRMFNKNNRESNPKQEVTEV